MDSTKCRICMNESDDSKTLFDSTGGKILNTTGKMYEICLGIEIVLNTGYPRQICGYCNLQLNVFYKFSLMAKKSNAIFEEKYKNQNIDSIKDENLFPEEIDQIKMLDNAAEYGDYEIEYLEDIVDEKDGDNNIYGPEIDEDTGIVSGELEDDSDVLQLPMFDTDDTEQDGETDYFDENSIQTINNEKELVLKCRNCAEEFSSTSKYRKHRRELHQMPQQVCKICGKRFRNLEIFASHMNVHKGLPAFQCEICSKTFKFRLKLREHMLLHTNDRPFKCNLCEKGFTTKWSLVLHIRMHNDIRKCECEICGLKFRMQSHLNSHRYTHREKSFECDICHQMYTSPRTLKQHKMSIHSNETPHTCQICSKKFKRKHHLITHFKVHNILPIP